MNRQVVFLFAIIMMIAITPVLRAQDDEKEPIQVIMKVEGAILSPGTAEGLKPMLMGWGKGSMLFGRKLFVEVSVKVAGGQQILIPSTRINPDSTRTFYRRTISGPSASIGVGLFKKQGRLFGGFGGNLGAAFFSELAENSVACQTEVYVQFGFMVTKKFGIGCTGSLSFVSLNKSMGAGGAAGINFTYHIGQ